PAVRPRLGALARVGRRAGGGGRGKRDQGPRRPPAGPEDGLRDRHIVKKRSASGLWGGRFSHPPSALLRRLNDSFAFDRRLLPEEIAASRAWARALRRAGALGAPEERRLMKALEDL